MSNKEIAPNVLAFIDRAAVLVAKAKEQSFSISAFCAIRYGASTSPIEHLFVVAMQAMCEGGGYAAYNPEPTGDGSTETPGLHVFPQHPVGKFRVDFLIYYVSHDGVAGVPVVVELDGHDFHDKDKKQRAYEKGRDRFLVKQGLKVLHFTGSEVVKDPFAVAFEAMEAAEVPGATLGFSATDPLGIGE